MNDLDPINAIGDQRREERRRGMQVFQNWKRNATIAFVGLALANAFAIWWVSDTRGEREQADAAFAQQLAQYVGGETLGACNDVNDLRDGIRAVLNRSKKNIRRLERQGAFPAAQADEQIRAIVKDIARFKEKSCSHAISGLPSQDEGTTEP